MCDFSFAIISYNQEEYIIQLLESIKYQIERFGFGKKIQLILGDDCSQDRTVQFAKEWLLRNKGLFSDVDIITRSKNVGIICNMAEVSKWCLSNKNIIIAGDDLIYRNNLLEKVGLSDVILSPTIEFNDDGWINGEIMVEFIELLHYQSKSDLKRHIRKMLDYRQCIASPGVLLAVDLWNDQEFLNLVKNFRNIEDICEWYYLFNKYPKEFSLSVDDQPFIMYRTNSGVSESLGRRKDNPIEMEFKAIRKKIPCKEDFLPKYVNPYKYAHAVKTKLIYKKWAKEPVVSEHLAAWNLSLSGAEEYLRMIKERANRFYQEIGV